MIDLLTTIKTRMLHHDPNDIVALMGYRKPDKAVERLNVLLATSDLLRWFDRSGFDFKYSNREFILKLGAILNIPQSELIATVTAVNKEQIRIEKMFQPYVFIDTQFRRASQPTFVLAVLEGLRHIHISKYDVLNNEDAELQRIKKIVLQHYQEHNGQLKLWGNIHQYVYAFDANQRLVILPDGTVTSDEEYQLQKTTLTLKGKDITPLFGAAIKT